MCECSGACGFIRTGFRPPSVFSVCSVPGEFSVRSVEGDSCSICGWETGVRFRGSTVSALSCLFLSRGLLRVRRIRVRGAWDGGLTTPRRKWRITVPGGRLLWCLNSSKVCFFRCYCSSVMGDLVPRLEAGSERGVFRRYLFLRRCVAGPARHWEDLRFILYVLLLVVLQWCGLVYCAVLFSDR